MLYSIWAKMQCPFRNLTFLAIPLAAFFLVGCMGDRGPALGKVSGHVTMDGKPLPSAMVTFSPIDGRRESFAITNSSGAYELRYTSHIRGAEIGEHQVRISPEGIEPKAARNPQSSTTAIPDIYYGINFLTFHVEKGNNIIDLALQSKANTPSIH